MVDRRELYDYINADEAQLKEGTMTPHREKGERDRLFAAACFAGFGFLCIGVLCEHVRPLSGIAQNTGGALLVICVAVDRFTRGN